MELHELEVGDGHAGAQGHRDAVAGGEERIRGHREALARATGRDHGVPRVDGLEHAGGVPRDHARGAALVHEEVDGQPAFLYPAPDCSTAATSARSISAPVASPPACTTRATE